MEAEAERLPISGAKQAAAYEDLSALNEDRRSGRQGRLAAASPLVPPLVWLILIVGALVVIAGVGLFADSAEARVPQAAMIAAVAGLVVSGLLLVRFLDKPYENQSGSIKPTALTRSLELMQREDQARNRHPILRCA